MKRKRSRKTTHLLTEEQQEEVRRKVKGRMRGPWKRGSTRGRLRPPRRNNYIDRTRWRQRRPLIMAVNRQKVITQANRQKDLAVTAEKNRSEKNKIFHCLQGGPGISLVFLQEVDT